MINSKKIVYSFFVPFKLVRRSMRWPYKCVDSDGSGIGSDNGDSSNTCSESGRGN